MKFRAFLLFILILSSFLYGDPAGNSNEFHPLDLISPKRADLMAKYIYAKHREWETKSLFGLNIYYRHLQVWNGFHEGDPYKLGFNDFHMAFNNLLDSIKHNGFNPAYPVPLGPTGVIFNGAHRVVSCLLYNKLVLIERGVVECDYGFTFFRNKKLEPKYLDAMALQYCELKPDSYMLIVFPSATGQTDNVEKIIKAYADIVYKKEIEFTKKGGLNFILTAYENELFITYPLALRNKVLSCFPEKSLKTNKARVYLLQSKELKLIKQCKAEIRALFNISNDSVHATDTHAEAITLARTLFNSNSVHCLNHRNHISTPIFDHYLTTYRAWLASNTLEEEWFCLDGGAVLAAYGLRDCNDLDFLCYKNEVAQIGVPGIENHNYQLKYYSTPLDDILFDPDHHFFYKGIKFCSLSVVKSMKKTRGEPKDLHDIILINKLPKQQL